MTPIADHSVIGAFNYAHSFLGAAKALDRLNWEDKETHSDSPTEFLYWHSIELFLKAFLMLSGVPPKKLVQKYGHNISKLTAEAKERGLALSPKDEELLSYMPSTEEMVNLRYLKIGVRTVAEMNEVEDTCDHLYRLIGPEIQLRGISIGFHASKISGSSD